MTGAALNRYASEQDVETPRDFIDTVEKRFGGMMWDLAASPSNAKALNCLTEREDALVQHWAALSPHGNMWLNPPFGECSKWAAKCALEAPRLPPYSRIFLLVPASVGANWFASHVHGRAYTIFLQGRLKFVGHQSCFPKDLCLAVYANGMVGSEIWKWRAA